MRRPVCVAALTAAAVLGTGGTAFAWWTTAGAGDGAAATAAARSAADVAAVTATAGGTGTLLHPGGTGDLVVTVHNGLSYPVSVTALTPSATGVTGCGTPALTVQTPTGYKVAGASVTLPQTIAAGGTTTFTLLGAVAMGTNASNDCQGKALSVPISVDWAG